MKKSFLAIAIAATTLFSACSAIKDKINVDIDMGSSNVAFTIPIITSPGSTNLGEQTIAVNIDSIIKANNAELAVGNIKSVKVKSCTVSMLNGDAANNFSALESCTASFKSNTKGDVVQIANLVNNPDVVAYTLDVPVDANLQLKDYFNATSFIYTLSGTTRKTTSKELNCTATIRYTMNVGL